MLDFDYIINETEKILTIYGIEYVDNEDEGEPGVNTFKIIMNEIDPSIDYRNYKFTISINYGSEENLKELYTDQIDKSIRNKFTVNSIVPNKFKGRINLNCEIII